MGRNTALVMVAAIIGITVIAVTALSLGYDTGIVAAAFTTLGAALGLGGGVLMARRRK